MAICTASAAEPSDVVNPPIFERRLPLFAAGDSWIYRQTIFRAGTSPVITVKQYTIGFLNKLNEWMVAIKTPAEKTSQVEAVNNFIGTPAFRIGADICMFDMLAPATLKRDRPCELPSKMGDVWVVDESNTYEQAISTYKVIGSELISVPAGSFSAIKIEGIRVVEDIKTPEQQKLSASETSEVKSLPSGPRKYRTTYWYVHQTKAMAKILREHFDAAGLSSIDSVAELAAVSLKGASTRKAIYQPTPSYPIPMLEKGIKGRVVFRFSLLPDGTVDEVRILQSPAEEFSASVIRTVKKWRFDAATSLPSERVWMDSSMNFDFEDSK